MEIDFLLAKKSTNGPSIDRICDFNVKYWASIEDPVHIHIPSIFRNDMWLFLERIGGENVDLKQLGIQGKPRNLF